MRPTAFLKALKALKVLKDPSLWINPIPDGVENMVAESINHQGWNPLAALSLSTLPLLAFNKEGRYFG